MTWAELEQIRQSLGLTQTAFAARLGVALSTLTGWKYRSIPPYIAVSARNLR
jgi:DNA-binding transcriptional regulator YiaG